MLTAVILFTSLTCQWCEMSKQSLRNNCIQYQEKVIKKDNSYGLSSVPVLQYKKNRYNGYPTINKWAKEHNQCNK